MRTPTTIGAIMSIMTDRPTKITFTEMRDMGVRGILIYCADYRCTVFELYAAMRLADLPADGRANGLLRGLVRYRQAKIARQ